MYVPVLDTEFAALDWRLVGDFFPGYAVQIEQIEEDWRSCEIEEIEEAEGSISDTPEGQLS